MAPQAGDALLKAAEAADSRELVALYGRHASRSDSYSFDELAQTLSKKLKPRLCAALLAQANDALRTLYAAPAAAQDGSAAMEYQEAAAAAVAALTAVTALAGALTAGAEAKAAPAELAQTVTLLHDGALLTPVAPMPLQEAVARLCEACWHGELPGKESVVAKTMPFVLMTALSTGKGADVKRCHALRGVLELFDFDDASIDSLKKLLLRAAFAPAFLKPAEGRRFLSHLFTLHTGLTRELYAIVRNQIPTGRAPLLDAYGEVLYRAWRTAVGGPAAELERTVLGGLASAALSASTPALAAALRRVLAALTDAKGAPGVDALLVRLLRPILFRGLAAANPAVRRNAGALLFASFPLQDPAAPAAEADELMARQAQAMADLLADDAPAVRASAVAGLAHVLDVFWELLPPATSAAYVTRLVDGLAHDAASAAVRAAVAAALTRLVANPAAQPLLRPLLPRAAHLLRDSSAAVRVAFGELLVAARGVRSIKFYDIVPIEELHAALASEEPRVARVLTRLLLPTYFPGGLPLAEAAKRVVALAGVAPATAAAFARHAAAAGAPRPALKALARVLAALLAAPPAGAAPRAEAAPKKGGKRRGRDASPAPTPSAALSPDLWLALADALAELCTGLQRRGEEKADAKAAAAEACETEDGAPPVAAEEAAEDEENEEDEEAMAKGIDAKGVMAALRAAPSSAGRAAVARAAAALPSADAVPLAAHCRAALAEGCDDDAEATALMAGLCAWGGVNDVVSMLASSLGGMPPPPARRGPKAAALPSIDAAHALRYSELLLGEPSCRDAALRCAAAPALLAALQSAAAAAVSAGAGAAAAAALRAAGKAAMHAGLARGGDANAAADAVAQLLTAAVAAAAAAPEDAGEAAAAPLPKTKGSGKRKARATISLEEEAPPTPAVAAALETALQLAAECAALGLWDGGDDSAVTTAAAAALRAMPIDTPAAAHAAALVARVAIAA